MNSVFNNELDLKLEKIVPLTPAQMYKGWTTPELLKQWFCPKPWTVSHCELDLRVGGKFNTTMQSPEGQDMQMGQGCYLEIIENKKLVWTDALTEGFRPAKKTYMTAIITFEEAPNSQTLYKVHILHSNPEEKKAHDEMGFEAGWSAALEQLITLMKQN